MCKKILLSIIVLAGACFAQTDRGTATMMANIIQPTKSISGFSYTDSIYTIPNSKHAKAAELRMAADTGYLEIHLISDPATTWYKMPMYRGVRSTAIFDKIRQRNTTVHKDSTILFIIEDY